MLREALGVVLQGISKPIILPTHATETRDSLRNAQIAHNIRVIRVESEKPWLCFGCAVHDFKEVSLWDKTVTRSTLDGPTVEIVRRRPSLLTWLRPVAPAMLVRPSSSVVSAIDGDIG